MRTLAAVLWTLGVGCGSSLADPMGRENELEMTQREYTKMVRWGEIERASAYVDPALRQDFLVHGPQLEGIRITDFEIGQLEMQSSDEATVTVTYRAFAIATASEKPIREKQLWFREKGLSNTWRVRSDLPELLSALAGR